MFAGTARSAAAQSTRDVDARELERLEVVWNEAHEHGDAGALETLWADDMEVAVPKMPVLTKADALKFARSGRMKFLSYKTSDIRVRVYGNAAVVTGRLQRTRSTLLIVVGNHSAVGMKRQHGLRHRDGESLSRRSTIRRAY